MPLNITPIVAGARVPPARDHVRKLIENDAAGVRAFEQIEAEVNRLDNLVRTMAGQIASLNLQLSLQGGSFVYVLPFTLTENFEVPVPGSIPVGSLIVYVFIQDATGGWTVTFPDPPFLNMLTEADGSATQVGLEADSVSTLALYLQDPDTIRPALAGYGGVL